MEDTFVTKNEFGLDVTCKVLATFEIEGEINKFIAYTDYIYDKDMHYNIYFGEIVIDNDEYIIEKIEDDNLIKTLEEMYQEGMGDKNDVQ